MASARLKAHSICSRTVSGTVPSGPQSDLAGDVSHAPGHHGRRVFKGVENAIAAEHGVVLGQSQAHDGGHGGSW